MIRSHDPLLSDPIVSDAIVGSYEQLDPTVGFFDLVGWKYRQMYICLINMYISLTC